FVGKLKDSVAAIGDCAQFEAKISSVPEAQVMWCKDGVPLKPSDRVEIKHDGECHALILKDLKMEDCGVIECKAQNAKGAVVDTCNLKVQGKLYSALSVSLQIHVTHLVGFLQTISILMINHYFSLQSQHCQTYQG